MEKRLYRSRSDRMLAGVAGGLADYLAVDPTLVRLLWVLVALFGGGGIIAYIMAWILIPEEPLSTTDKDVDQEPTADKVGQNSARDNSLAFGLVLIAVGSFFLVRKVIPAFSFELLWPLILVGVGLALLFSNRGEKK